jgi:hypothetical protein
MIQASEEKILKDIEEKEERLNTEKASFSAAKYPKNEVLKERDKILRNTELAKSAVNKQSSQAYRDNAELDYQNALRERNEVFRSVQERRENELLISHLEEGVKEIKLQFENAKNLLGDAALNDFRLQIESI